MIARQVMRIKSCIYESATEFPPCSYRIFSERELLGQVRYMSSQIRMSSVCRLSVTLVHPTQVVELFGNFFHHTIAQGLYFSDAKNRWWRSPLSP